MKITKEAGSWKVSILKKRKKWKPFNEDFFLMGAFYLFAAAISRFFDFAYTSLLHSAAILFVIWLVSVFAQVCYMKARLFVKFKMLKRSLTRQLSFFSNSTNPADIYKKLSEELLPLTRKAIPNKIYKYYSLNGDRELDNKKINSIETNNIWCSKYEEFNDPYEGKYLFLSKEEIDESILPYSLTDFHSTNMKTIYDHIGAICFTVEKDSLPMWAHYANNNMGFCIEYEVTSLEKLYPVMYSYNRQSAIGVVVSLIENYFKSQKEPDETKRTINFIIFLSCFKHEAWSNEREIRALILDNPENLIDGGRNVTCAEIGVRPTKIFLGINCTQEHSKRLAEYAAITNLEIVFCSLKEKAQYSTV